MPSINVIYTLFCKYCLMRDQVDPVTPMFHSLISISPCGTLLKALKKPR